MTKMPKMQKIPNLLLLVSKDHQLIYFTMLSFLLNMQVTHMCRHYETIFSNTKLLLFSWPPMLPKKISLIIVEHGMDLIVEA
jgi:hypothetical protein